MLYYDKIDISEGIGSGRSNNSKEGMICHYWFFNQGYEFKDSVCNVYHDLRMLNVNFGDITIITVKNIDCQCIIHKVSKSEAINLLKNSVLEDRGYSISSICSELLIITNMH